MAFIVYTLFNSAGDLIYAGQTKDLTARLYHHAQKPWFNEIKKVLKVEYRTRRDALDAERSIIAAERPTYNLRGDDICPRCRTNLRERNGQAGYCHPCRVEYTHQWKTLKGWTPRPPPTTICPKCKGTKEPGPAYCNPCKNAVDAEYRKNKKP